MGLTGTPNAAQANTQLYRVSLVEASSRYRFVDFLVSLFSDTNTAGYLLLGARFATLGFETSAYTRSSSKLLPTENQKFEFLKAQ